MQTTSKEAAAAAAAGTVLVGLYPQEAGELKTALAAYLATIPDGDAKSDGIKLGEAVAAKVLRRAPTTAPMRRMRIDQDQARRLCADADHRLLDLAERRSRSR